MTFKAFYGMTLNPFDKGFWRNISMSLMITGSFLLEWNILS